VGIGIVFVCDRAGGDVNSVDEAHAFGRGSSPGRRR
jgi:hypothetical protein